MEVYTCFRDCVCEFLCNEVLRGCKVYMQIISGSPGIINPLPSLPWTHTAEPTSLCAGRRTERKVLTVAFPRRVLPCELSTTGFKAIHSSPQTAGAEEQESCLGLSHRTAPW